MKISKNFTIEEFIKSTTAKNKKIDNTIYRKVGKYDKIS